MTFDQKLFKKRLRNSALFCIHFITVRTTLKCRLFALSLILLISTSYAQNQVGIFSNHSDIGKPKLAGDVVFNNEDQIYNLKGSGYNIWFGRDEFHYAYNKIKGNFILTPSPKY